MCVSSSDLSILAYFCAKMFTIKKLLNISGIQKVTQ